MLFSVLQELCEYIPHFQLYKSENDYNRTYETLFIGF